ncbi:MAG: LD-carboxypeptidase [Muribaculaceae bacterium]|nr:LD-carboxypeptidase [Muribaculaceae bacterium]
MKSFISPSPLSKGDKIAICSPAGPVNPENVYGAVEALRMQGWNPLIMPHALGRSGNYSGTADERFDDLCMALTDPQIRAILCSRGGYGVVHILDRLEKMPLQTDPKWIIGFSDISALHALMASKGISSIHASMASHIRLGDKDEDNRNLFAILSGKRPAISFPAHQYDRPGIADGILLGGNLAVLADLIDTPYNILHPDTILFLEDVAEPIYKIERILYQLRYNGVLPSLKGLIVGRFTEYRPDNSYSDMETMIRDMTANYSYPVAFNAPIGHVDHNIPMIEGAHATLKVTTTGENHLIYWK